MKWLENALDWGIAECDFWQMTMAELDRAIASKKRVKMAEAQERASFDYKLSDLIGRSISRIYGSSNKLPEITEAYPNLFDTKQIEESKRQKQMELSAIRFKQFAYHNNKKYQKGGSK